MDKVFDFVLVVLAVSAVSLTVTRSHLTEKYREYLLDNLPGIFFTKMVTCPYCFAHWAALFGAGLYFLWFPGGFNPVNYVVVWFAVVAASAIVMGLMTKLLLHSEWEMEKLKRRLREQEKNDAR